MKGKSYTIADTIWQTKISSNQKSCDYSNLSQMSLITDTCNEKKLSVARLFCDTVWRYHQYSFQFRQLHVLQSITSLI